MLLGQDDADSLHTGSSGLDLSLSPGPLILATQFGSEETLCRLTLSVRSRFLEGSVFMPSLEYLDLAGGRNQRVALDAVPFILGRKASAHFVIHSTEVSKEHAEIYVYEGKYRIRDLRSTNGTCVNGKPVDDIELQDGDIIHLGQSEFRFLADAMAPVDTEMNSLPGTELAPKGASVPPSVLYGRPLLLDLLKDGAVRAVFQPIVDLHTSTTIAHEALGRGTSRDLSTRPVELFRLASKCNLARELSQLFRRAALRDSRQLDTGTTLFCNLHPLEVKHLDDAAMDELIPTMPVGHRLVLEVHEDAVTDLATLRRLREHLKKRGVGLAYDDFGAGQSRIAELAEVPPDYIKLDMRLIRDIDRMNNRQDVVRAICTAAASLGVAVIAEGLERKEEADTCKALGCRYGQGFLLGHPEIRR